MQHHEEHTVAPQDSFPQPLMGFQHLEDWSIQTWVEWISITDFLSLSQTCKLLSDLSSENQENEQIWMILGKRRHPHFSQISACSSDKILNFVSLVAFPLPEDLASHFVISKTNQRTCFNYLLYKSMHLAEWGTFFAFGRIQFESLIRNALLMHYASFVVVSGTEPSGDGHLSGSDHFHTVSARRHYASNFAESKFTPLMLPSLLCEGCIQSSDFRKKVPLILLQSMAEVLILLQNFGSLSGKQYHDSAVFMGRTVGLCLEVCRSITNADFPMSTVIELTLNFLGIASRNTPADVVSMEVFNAQTMRRFQVKPLVPGRLFQGLPEICGEFSLLCSDRVHQFVISCVLEKENPRYRFRDVWELAVEFMLHDVGDPTPQIAFDVEGLGVFFFPSRWAVDFVDGLLTSLGKSSQ
jgi:hypothetical protein